MLRRLLFRAHFAAKVSLGERSGVQRVRRAATGNAPADAAAAGPAGGYVFTIDRGNVGQPQLRDTLTVTPPGHAVRFEPFSEPSHGRQLRSIARFTHTGEVMGVAGQTVAGLAAAGKRSWLGPGCRSRAVGCSDSCEARTDRRPFEENAA